MVFGSETTGILEEIITVTGGSIEDTLDRIGPRRAAQALVEELLSRCDAPALTGDLEIHLQLGFRGEPIDYVVRFENRSVAARPGVPQSPWAQLSFALVGLADTLFGRRSATDPPLWSYQGLKVATPDTSPEEIRELLKVQADAMRANDALLAACAPFRPSLNELASRFATDKWGMVHWYTPHYAHHFERFADEPVRVLEIGIGGYRDVESGGASLRMWQQFFRRGIVYGLDIFEKRIDMPRVRTVQGNQGDPVFLKEMAEEIGPFDIIIDDGSHLNRHVLTSFEALFPYLKEGGIYAVEDLQTSYWPGWGGSEDGVAATSSMGFLKGLLDGLHYREYDRPASQLDESVFSLHFYHNLACVVKGRNTESGAPAQVRDLPPFFIPADEDGSS